MHLEWSDIDETAKVLRVRGKAKFGLKVKDKSSGTCRSLPMSWTCYQNGARLGPIRKGGQAPRRLYRSHRTSATADTQFSPRSLRVAPRGGAWIETCTPGKLDASFVAPRQGRVDRNIILPTGRYIYGTRSQEVDLRSQQVAMPLPNDLR